MQHVYLDQNKWIELGRVLTERDANPAIDDLLLLMDEAHRLGHASFPLSLIHYQEVWHRRDHESRHRLANVMAAVSDFNTIASLHEVLPCEIDAALRAMFGRPLEVRTYPIFGWGVAHAMGDPRFAWEPPQHWGLSEDQGQVVKRLMESALLGGPSADLPRQDFDTTKFRENSAAYREWEENLVGNFQRERASADLKSRAVLVSEILDVRGPTLEALARAGISESEFMAREAEGLTEFMMRVPTRWAGYRLRDLRHENPQHPWTDTDLNDLQALTVAIVYCDVVVTEKSWTHLIKKGRLDEWFGTRVISNLAELTPILAMAA